MIAYIFSKDNRIIINKVENITETNGVFVLSITETFKLDETVDFVISDKIYNYDDILPISESNKQIISIEDRLSLMQKALDSLALGGI